MDKRKSIQVDLEVWRLLKVKSAELEATIGEVVGLLARASEGQRPVAKPKAEVRVAVAVAESEVSQDEKESGAMTAGGTGKKMCRCGHPEWLHGPSGCLKEPCACKKGVLRA